MSSLSLRLNVIMKTYQSKSSTYTNRQRGMTLIELMVATVILAIIASVALPAMRDLFTRKSAQSISTFFERSIKMARVEATQRSSTVRVKPTSNTNDWSQGWFIEYTDVDGPKVIKRFDALPNNPVFTIKSTESNIEIEIKATGQVNTPGDFDLYYPGCTGNERYNLQVLLSGLISKGVTACPM